MWQPTSVWWRPEGSRPSGQNPDGDSLHPKYSHLHVAATKEVMCQCGQGKTEEPRL